MSKKDELMTVKWLVRSILEKDQRARNSDSFLYLRVLQTFADKNGIDITKIPVPDFLVHMNEWGFPPFETVRRNRQIAQRKFPHLAASKAVQEARSENEEAFLEYVRECY